MNKRRLIIAKAAWLMATFATQAMPNSEPTSTQQFGASYPTVDAAAVAALQAVVTCQHSGHCTAKFEYAGVIVQWRGRDWITAPITSRDEASINGFHVMEARGAVVVALYHTHPSGAMSTFLSPEDVEFANQQHWISYVGIFDRNAIVRYIPGKTATEPMRQATQCNLGLDVCSQIVSLGEVVASLR